MNYTKTTQKTSSEYIEDELLLELINLNLIERPPPPAAFVKS